MSHHKSEHKLTSPDTIAVLDEVFLTPRVINRQSFEAYAHRLGELIAEACEQSQSLVEAGGEIRSLGDSARAAAGDLRASVEAALSVVPRLNERVAAAQRAVDAAADGTQLAKAIESRLSATLDEHLGNFERRVGEIVDRASERIAQLAETRIERGEALANRLETDLIEGERKALVIEQQLAERIGAAQHRIKATIKEATDQIESLDGRIAGAAEQFDRHLDRGSDRVAARIEQLKEDLGRAATPTMQSLGVLTRAAAEIIGRDLRAPKGDAKAKAARPGGLADLVERAERVTEVLERVTAVEPIDAPLNTPEPIDQDATPEPTKPIEPPVVCVVAGVSLAAPRTGPVPPAPAGFRRVDR